MSSSSATAMEASYTSIFTKVKVSVCMNEFSTLMEAIDMGKSFCVDLSMVTIIGIYKLCLTAEISGICKGISVLTTVRRTNRLSETEDVYTISGIF